MTSVADHGPGRNGEVARSCSGTRAQARGRRSSSAFPNPRAVYDVLRRLDRGGVVPQTRIRDHLLEVREHIATGNPSRADRGRSYTRRAPEGRLWVFAHRRRDGKEQQQLYDRLAKRPLERLMASA